MQTIITTSERGGWLLPSLLSLVVFAGCAGPRCNPLTGLSPATPAAAAAADHLGERVRWGGSLASTRHLSDSTEIEVIAYPLDDCGRPQSDAAPIGRFILVRPGFVETAGRPPGSLLSATGLIVGRRDGRIGEAEYPFAVLRGHSLTWWPAVGSTMAVSPRPWVTIGVGGGSGGYGGGIGVYF
jgi:outer membrane lipoprotein